MNNIIDGLKSLAVPIEDVVHDPNNINRHPATQIAGLAARLSSYGQHRPLVVRRNDKDKFVCYIGNGTLAAAKTLGWDRIAVVEVYDDDAVARARALSDNTAHWGSYFDDATLREELSKISGETPNLLGTLGYDDAHLAVLLRNTTFSLPEDEENNRVLDSSRESDDMPRVPTDTGVDGKLKRNAPRERDDYLSDATMAGTVVTALEAAEWATITASGEGITDVQLRVLDAIFAPTKFVVCTDGGRVRVRCVAGVGTG